MVEMPGCLKDIPFDELLGLEGLDDGFDAPVYVSGSLVEGYGNTGSDIDIFVISEKMPSGEMLMIKKTHSISIHFWGKRRVDFEYWPQQQVQYIAGALSEAKVGIDFVADKLDLFDEIFIHRLKIGIPLKNYREFSSLQSIFDFEHFRAYLTQQAIHRIDGALEDVSGMLEDDDLETGVFRARELISLGVDAWCHYQGNTNPLPKWRMKILTKLEDTHTKSNIIEKVWKLQFPPLERVYNKPASAKLYMQDCISFVNNIVEKIQK